MPCSFYGHLRTMTLWWIVSNKIPIENEPARLIKGSPISNLSIKLLHDHTCIMHECIAGCPVLPASFCFQILWQIPMINRHKRLNSLSETFINKIMIELKSFRIHSSFFVQNDPWPGKRKPERILSSLFHHTDIFFISVIKIRCYISVFQSFFM